MRRAAATAVLTLGLLAGCSGAGAAQRTDAPGALTVRELTVVDAQGTPRVRIGAPLPDPKGLKRAVTVTGIQFMGPEGQEVGGVAMIERFGVRGLCMDADENYEAACIGLEQGQPTLTLRHDWKERVTMGVDRATGVASIVLHDGEGRPRLRLAVARDGTVQVQGLEAR